MMSRNFLVVTADDFGLSPSLNEAVLSAAQKGTLSSASLLVSHPYAIDALSAAQQRAPQLGVGLHLNLTSGPSVLPPEKIPLLTDSNGRFRMGFLSLFLALNTGTKKKIEEFRRQIRLEWNAQLELFCDFHSRFAFLPDHIDSHQHIHVIPGLDSIFWMIFNEKRSYFQWTPRLPLEHFGSLRRITRRFPYWFPFGLMKREILRFCVRKTMRKQNVSRGFSPAYFGILDSGRMNLPAGRAVLESWDVAVPEIFGSRCAELNLHPSVDSQLASDCVCSDADREFHTAKQRREEFDLLMNPMFSELLAQKSIRIVPFTEIGTPPCEKTEI